MGRLQSGAATEVAVESSSPSTSPVNCSTDSDTSCSSWSLDRSSRLSWTRWLQRSKKIEGTLAWRRCSNRHPVVSAHIRRPGVCVWLSLDQWPKNHFCAAPAKADRDLWYLVRRSTCRPTGRRV